MSQNNGKILNAPGPDYGEKLKGDVENSAFLSKLIRF